MYSGSPSDPSPSHSPLLVLRYLEPLRNRPGEIRRPLPSIVSKEQSLNDLSPNTHPPVGTLISSKDRLLSHTGVGIPRVVDGVGVRSVPEPLDP